MQDHYFHRHGVFGKQNAAWDKITYGPVRHWTPITASSKTNRTSCSNSSKRTRCSSRANTAPIPHIQPTKINASPVVNVAVYSESKMAHEVKLNTVPCILHRTPITASNKVNRIPRSNSYKRTYCASKANTVPVPYIQPTKINAGPLLSTMLRCIRKAKWRMR